MTTREQVWLGVQIGLVLVIAWRFFADRFASLNAFADAVERMMPRWFRWETRGDWISWVHHAIWTALVGTLGGLLSLAILGAFRPGFQRFAIAWAAFYFVREVWGFFWRDRQRDHVAKRALDGIMDFVASALVVVASFVV